MSRYGFWQALSSWQVQLHGSLFSPLPFWGNELGSSVFSLGLLNCGSVASISVDFERSCWVWYKSLNTRQQLRQVNAITNGLCVILLAEMSAHISQLAYKKGGGFSSINQPLLVAIFPQYLWVVWTQASHEIEIDIIIPRKEPSVGRALKCPRGKKEKDIVLQAIKDFILLTCMEHSTYFTNLGTRVTFIESSRLDFVYFFNFTRGG